MAGACSNQTLSQRWVTNTSFCLSGGSTIHVSDDVNAVEDFEQVLQTVFTVRNAYLVFPLVQLPLNTTYGLPELIEGESLSCLFTSKQHNISISVPLINSSCEVHNQLATAFKDLGKWALSNKHCGRVLLQLVLCTIIMWSNILVAFVCLLICSHTIELTVSLVGPLPAEPVITSIGNITVVSCSLAKRWLHSYKWTWICYH